MYNRYGFPVVVKQTRKQTICEPFFHIVAAGIYGIGARISVHKDSMLRLESINYKI